MLRTSSGRVVAASAVITLIAMVVVVVYFLQPWRSCDYEDSSAGCAMLPEDATVMSVAMLTTLVSAAVLISTLFIRRHRSRS